MIKAFSLALLRKQGKAEGALCKPKIGGDLEGEPIFCLRAFFSFLKEFKKKREKNVRSKQVTKALENNRRQANR